MTDMRNIPDIPYKNTVGSIIRIIEEVQNILKRMSATISGIRRIHEKIATPSSIINIPV